MGSFKNVTYLYIIAIIVLVLLSIFSSFSFNFRSYHQRSEKGSTRSLESIFVEDFHILPKEYVRLSKHTCGKKEWIIVDSINFNQEILDFGNNGCLLIIPSPNHTFNHLPQENIIIFNVHVLDVVISFFPNLSLFQNKLSVRNACFLYAVLNGARTIFEVDERFSASISSKLFEEDILHFSHGISSEDSNVMNPLFHCPSYWPRGLPLDCLKNKYFIEKNVESKIGVIQIIQSNFPDVDLLSEITSHSLRCNISLLSDRFSIPLRSFAPLSSSNIIFLEEAVWGVFLPNSLNPRVQDIWRGYIHQRLFWQENLQVGFFIDSTIKEFSKNGEFLKGRDLEESLEVESDLYFRTRHLIEALYRWKPKSNSFLSNYEDLVITLCEEGFLIAEDVKLYQQWMLSLLKLKVPLPSKAIASKILFADKKCEKNTRILVTGVAGMIGSHVARVLLKKPCTKLFGLVRPRTNLDTLQGVLQDINLVFGDVTDYPRMYSLLDSIKPHYIYHFAAQAINGISYDIPQVTLDANVQGTMNILESLRRLQINPRVLLAGSSTEYGHTADTWNGPIPENVPLQPVSPYGVSKVAMENLGNQYFFSFGISVITARFFIQVGVGGTDSLAIHQFCKQIAMAENGLAPPVIYHGNLDTLRDMTDARDSAEIIVTLAETGIPGEAYNIGSGNAISIRSLLEIAISLSKINVDSVEELARHRQYDEKILLADNSKIRNLTNWIPSTNMTETVISILHYWRSRVKNLYLVE
jgi:GDP-4-dehydro-6-deoxy-D-mannose reductase